MPPKIRQLKAALKKAGFSKEAGKGRPMNPNHYSMVIQWDDQDKIYIVSVPELPGCRTHGHTYNEAIKNALEVIELWIEAARKVGEPIPPPRIAA